jgi:hypothetical protein
LPGYHATSNDTANTDAARAQRGYRRGDRIGLADRHRGERIARPHCFVECFVHDLQIRRPRLDVAGERNAVVIVVDRVAVEHEAREVVRR